MCQTPTPHCRAGVVIYYTGVSNSPVLLITKANMRARPAYVPSACTGALDTTPSYPHLGWTFCLVPCQINGSIIADGYSCRTSKVEFEQCLAV